MLPHFSVHWHHDRTIIVDFGTNAPDKIVKWVILRVSFLPVLRDRLVKDYNIFAALPA